MSYNAKALTWKEWTLYKISVFSLSTCGFVTKRPWIPHTQCWIPHLLLPAHPISGLASLLITQPNRDYLIPPFFSPFTATLVKFAASTSLMILVSVYVFQTYSLLLEFISSGFCNFVIGQTVHINISYCCYWFSKLKSTLFHRTFTYISPVFY